MSSVFNSFVDSFQDTFKESSPDDVVLPTRSLDMTVSGRRLSMSNANYGAYDHAKMAVSVWIKQTAIGATRTIYTQGATAANIPFVLRFSTSNKLEVFTLVGAAVNGQLTTTATFTDTANWHHIMMQYDSANGTAGDRLRLWFDGAEITAFDTDTNPTAAMQTSTEDVVIGATSTGTFSLQGEVYQPALFSGTLPDITDVYDGGAAKNLTGLPGLFSLLSTNETDALEDDFVIATNWTNNNGIVKTTDIP